MNNTIKALLLLTIGISQFSFAGSGIGIIPSYITDVSSNFRTFIYMSNITSVPANVTVTLYEADGQVVKDTGGNPSTGYLQAFNVDHYSELNTNGTVTFTIPPNSTSTFALQSTKYNSGYGKIEWEQPGASYTKALVAHSRTYRVKSGVESAYSTHINNGAPF